MSQFLKKYQSNLVCTYSLKVESEQSLIGTEIQHALKNKQVWINILILWKSLMKTMQYKNIHTSSNTQLV